MLYSRVGIFLNYYKVMRNTFYSYVILITSLYVCILILNGDTSILTFNFALKLVVDQHRI